MEAAAEAEKHKEKSYSRQKAAKAVSRASGYDVIKVAGLPHDDDNDCDDCALWLS